MFFEVKLEMANRRKNNLIPCQEIHAYFPKIPELFNNNA